MASPPRSRADSYGPDSSTRVVAGMHRVTTLLDRIDSADSFDALEVVSPPGSSVTMHRHFFSVWYRVRSGELEVIQALAGHQHPRQTLRPGQSLLMPPSTYHALRNTGRTSCSFEVIGQPAMLSGFVAEAGTRTQAGLDGHTGVPAASQYEQLLEIAQRWGIEVAPAGSRQIEPPPGGRP